MSFSTAGWYLHKSLMIWCCCASSSADDPKNWRANVYYFVQINWYWPIHSQCLCVYGCVCGERNERTNTAEEWWQGNTLNRWIMFVYRVLVPRSVKIPLTTTTEWDNVRAENGRGTDRENQKEREREVEQQGQREYDWKQTHATNTEKLLSSQHTVRWSMFDGWFLLFLFEPPHDCGRGRWWCVFCCIYLIHTTMKCY